MKPTKQTIDEILQLIDNLLNLNKKLLYELKLDCILMLLCLFMGLILGLLIGISLK